MLPARQIFAVEKLLPFIGIALAGILIFVGTKGEHGKTGQQKD
jgi:hypothetical protein